MSISTLLNRIIYKSRILLLRTLNEFVPKQDNKIVLSSLPDFSDNAKGLWEYLAGSEKYEPVWLFSDKSLVEKLSRENITCEYSWSWKGIKALLTSRYIACTHSQHIAIKSSNQFLITLWHGMPLKSMGYIDNLCTKKDIKGFKTVSKKSDIFISTSPIMRYALASCFNIDARKVVITGQPRNDKLFSPEDRAVLSRVCGKNLDAYDKLILYCPTFRAGMGRVEGKKLDKNVFNFPDYQRNELDELLKSHNALLVIKLHPFEEKQYSGSELDLPQNSVLVKSDAFNTNTVSMYDILGLFDVLVTDYSSIYFDYLLLDRPIVFVTSDLNTYKSGRGLIFEDYDFWTPGPKTKTFDEYVQCLRKCLQDKEYYKAERKLVNGLVNQYTDNRSAERIMQCVEKTK
ncbi:MAG: CDP-glycerol glycerophosphotransferase family protein [Clostridia bacterium]|nr:CDP-glycerol glycerophosphotransferase family protein [Clostridia bacterium]